MMNPSAAADPQGLARDAESPSYQGAREWSRTQLQPRWAPLLIEDSWSAGHGRTGGRTGCGMNHLGLVVDVFMLNPLEGKQRGISCKQPAGISWFVWPFQINNCKELEKIPVAKFRPILFLVARTLPAKMFGNQFLFDYDMLSWCFGFGIFVWQEIQQAVLQVYAPGVPVA